MNSIKKTNSVLKIERPGVNVPSKLQIADESIQPKKLGRKPTSTDEKATEIISFKVTSKQKAYIERQAGLAKVATFIKAKLKESGVIKDIDQI